MGRKPQPLDGWLRMRPRRHGATLTACETAPKGVPMRKVAEYGGIAASIVLIAFGAASIALGILGVNEVRDSLARE